MLIKLARYSEYLCKKSPEKNVDGTTIFCTLRFGGGVSCICIGALLILTLLALLISPDT